MGIEAFCMALVSPKTDSSFVAYDLVLGVPAVAFLCYLGWKLRQSLRKLQRSQSQIMATYYCFLWLVATLNVVRFLVQSLEGFSQRYLALWNSLWLLTRFGLVLLEVSVVVFLLQGYFSSGSEALIRTLGISGTYTLLESTFLAVAVFHFKVPLFFHGASDSQEMSFAKWGCWLAHALLFLCVYQSLSIVPFTKWRDLLPARPSFHRYVLVMFIVNLLASLGALMLGSGAAKGYCVYGISNFLYYDLYPPLLYLTFLAEFFDNSEDELDLLLYSEMKDAGVFDSREYSEF